MKHPLKIMLFFFLFLSLFNYSKAQYVTLEGRQFKDEYGNDFYPLLMNYNLTILYNQASDLNPANPNFYIAHWNKYGDFAHHSVDQCSTMTACGDMFYADFMEIKEMGFNAVKLIIAPAWDNATDNFIFKTRINSQLGGNGDADLLMDPSITNNNNLSWYFQLLDDVIQQAAACSLKVMLCGVYFGNRDFDQNDADQISKATAILEAMGTHFTNNTGILAYSMLFEISAHDADYSLKGTVCTTVRDFYDALKTADPNHLITLTSLDILTVFNWDPGVMKLDFFQTDLYAYKPQPWESPTDLVSPRNRVISQLYWLGNNCPLPWMMGETGYPANDVTYNPADPYWGALQDQADYAQLTLDASRNYGASGYAWWQYQDWSEDNTSANDGWGLLTNGAIITPPANNLAFEKPAVAEFKSYLNNNMAPPVIPPTQPPTDYYDPMRTAYYLNLNCPTCGINPLTGTISDQNANHIEGALVFAHTWMKNESNPPFNPIDNSFYTFTNDNGGFALTPFDPEDPTDPSSQYIRWVQISAVGSQLIEDGHWWDHPLCTGCSDPSHQVQSGQTFVLNKINLNLNSTVENQTVNSGNSPTTFEAWRTLTVTNNNTVESGGMADFKALDEVKVEDEFHAKYGSEVHIYNETVLLECSDISGFRMITHPASSSYTKPGNKSLEIVFKKKNLPEGMTIFPNPNSGIFWINYTGNSDKVKKIKVYDILGNTLMSDNFTGNETQLNLTHKPKGIYILEVQSETKVFNQKIIIQ